MRRYDACIFDFDGTLVDTEWAIYQEVNAIFQREGYELPIQMYAQCVGSSYATWSPQSYLEELSGKEYDWEAINMVRDKKIYTRLEQQGLMDGVMNALKYCQREGLTLAVASSSTHKWVDGWLEKLGIASYFTAVMCKDDVQEIKPAPELFLKTAEALERLPNQCLVIEDSRNGMLAAQAARMDTMMVPNRITSSSDFKGSTFLISSLSSFSDALR